MPKPIKSKVSSSAGCSVAVLVFALASSVAAQAQPAPSPNASPPQVQQLLQLMQDPIVRAWMDEQQRPVTSPTMAAAPPTMSGMMTQRIADLREHLASLAAAMPQVPGEFLSATHRLFGELQGWSVLAVLALLTGFLALEAGTE
jgi:moderate conductance mechanosensitive channel